MKNYKQRIWKWWWSSAHQSNLKIAPLVKNSKTSKTGRDCGCRNGRRKEMLDQVIAKIFDISRIMIWIISWNGTDLWCDARVQPVWCTAKSKARCGIGTLNTTATGCALATLSCEYRADMRLVYMPIFSPMAPETNRSFVGQGVATYVSPSVEISNIDWKAWHQYQQLVTVMHDWCRIKSEQQNLDIDWKIYEAKQVMI